MRPANLVVIMSDEHHPRALGAAGHPFVRTPNLDRLAAAGTRFTAAYCNSPICVPSRASFATGRQVHEIGTWDNALAYDGRIAGWGHALQRAGHRVESIGKLHYRSADDPTGFDRQHLPMHIYGGYGMVWGALRDGRHDFTKRAHDMLKPIGPGTSKYNTYDDRIAGEAERWIAETARAPGDKPWVLFVGFVAPHFPLTVPQEYLDLYPPERMPAPRLHPSRGYVRHPWVDWMHRCSPVDDGLDEPGRKLAAACYYGLCSWVDHQVGRVLGALDRAGIADTTRVIYTSDHGDNIGARGMWGKSTLYDDSVGVPLIMAGPGVAAGKECPTAVSLVDVAPTILASVGAPASGDGLRLGGQSLFDIAAAPANPGREVLSQYHAFAAPSAAFMLRDGRYKYNHYVGYGPELFDMMQDPMEERDLSGDPAKRPVLEAYERRLRAILDPEAVDGRAKADQAALIERHGGPEKAYHLGAPGATPAPV